MKTRFRRQDELYYLREEPNAQTRQITPTGVCNAVRNAPVLVAMEALRCVLGILDRLFMFQPPALLPTRRCTESMRAYQDNAGPRQKTVLQGTHRRPLRGLDALDLAVHVAHGQLVAVLHIGDAAKVGGPEVPLEQTRFLDATTVGVVMRGAIERGQIVPKTLALSKAKRSALASDQPAGICTAVAWSWTMLQIGRPRRLL